ncbi:hypothetical protein SKAU_G00143060 [Synaphobranchus kaupii]|uniref:Uncharacterized protein n=1 Tax=Synaphobranchus kaupii TaxID=118154 RepID=A0A9Q1FTJ9_SYNKA|nr:hypothetical protein SKAU_G00143060 [Synaphobranchus kaupii]
MSRAGEEFRDFTYTDELSTSEYCRREDRRGGGREKPRQPLQEFSGKLPWDPQRNDLPAAGGRPFDAPPRCSVAPGTHSNM